MGFESHQDEPKSPEEPGLAVTHSPEPHDHHANNDPDIRQLFVLKQIEEDIAQEFVDTKALDPEVRLFPNISQKFKDPPVGIFNLDRTRALKKAIQQKVLVSEIVKEADVDDATYQPKLIDFLDLDKSQFKQLKEKFDSQN